MRAPTISVLMPAYNAAATLASAIRSIRAQSCGDFECVVVDDGSTDDTPALLERVSARDPRVRWARIEHRGIVAALNRGLELCRGRFIARMDADDRMHPTRLERQLRTLQERPELAAVGSHVTLFPRARLTDGRRAYAAWLSSLVDEDAVRRERYIECPLAHPTLFFRASVLARYRYRDRGWPEDYDLVLRLLESGERLGVVPEPLLSWRDRPTRASRTDPSYALDRFVACKAAFLREAWLDSGRYVLWGYGDTGRTLCKALRALGATPSHIVELHPGRIGQRVAGAPVIHPEALPGLTPRPHRIVVSVAGAGARALIREALSGWNFTEERDFICAA